MGEERAASGVPSGECVGGSVGRARAPGQSRAGAARLAGAAKGRLTLGRCAAAPRTPQPPFRHHLVPRAARARAEAAFPLRGSPAALFPSASSALSRSVRLQGGHPPLWRGLSYLTVQNEAPRDAAGSARSLFKTQLPAEDCGRRKAKCGLGEASSARPWGGRVGRQLFSSVAPSLAVLAVRQRPGQRDPRCPQRSEPPG